MRDFTLRLYAEAAQAIATRFQAQTFAEFTHDAAPNAAVLRHDVDRRSQNAVACAQVLADLGLRGTFYFRYPYTFVADRIERIAKLGHEVGYHYETVTKARGDLQRAGELFADELAQFRRHFDVSTACMHGSPLSRWDNREMWKKWSLGDFGLKGEPYLTTDFRSTGYISDTGRSWNTGRANVRDHVDSPYTLSISTTPELISAVRSGKLPERMMFTFHPERWEDAIVPWTLQLCGQMVRNRIKSVLVALRQRGNRHEGTDTQLSISAEERR